MSDYEIDVAADQIAHWLKDELAGGNRSFAVRASREYVTEPLANRDEAGLGEEADAASLITVGILEAKPVGAREGWLLQVRVEDVVGPHVPEDESVQDSPEEIDLDDFIANFITPDRGTVYVTVSADTPEAKRSFDTVFGALVRDRHTGS